MNYLLSMLSYNKWANEQTLAALESAANPDPQAIRIFAHIMNAEEIWLQRIKKKEVTAAPWKERTLAECREAFQCNYDEYMEFLSWLRPDELKRDISYTDIKGNRWSMPLREIFVHVFNHATYHRGQVAWLLRAAGDTPNPTDYMLMIRKEEAEE